MITKCTVSRLLHAGCLVISLVGAIADAQDSIRWNTLREQFFNGARIVDDSRVEIVAPKSAEDSMNVPVSVRISGLRDVEEVHVLVDYNPIVKAIEFFPLRAAPALTFRLKLQQSSPIRALARTRDGIWHHAMTLVDAAGGGCTAPSTGSAAPDWMAELNSVASKRFARDGLTRLRLQIQHPMDTGLAPGVPAFFIERLSIMDSNNQELMRLHVFEPISENPIFSVDLPNATASGELSIRGTDNQGNRVLAKLAR
jgi:sulfur-oxidizing protein SoxY